MIENSTISRENKDKITQAIRVIPDYPKEGIMFKDITTLISNPVAMDILMTHLQNRYQSCDIDYVAGIEARGFIFGAILADRLGAGFVSIRKKGKLPYKTISKEYALEYGTDTIEVHTDSFDKEGSPARVVIIDDLLATGGTASAACELIEQSGAKCIEACFVMELEFLKGRQKISAPVYSVLIEE